MNTSRNTLYAAICALVITVGLGVTHASALAQNPWITDPTVERALHPVAQHTKDEKPPEIGYVLDEERQVVCYFYKHLHWYEGHPALSCVYLGLGMVVDDPPY